MGRYNKVIGHPHLMRDTNSRIIYFKIRYPHKLGWWRRSTRKIDVDEALIVAEDLKQIFIKEMEEACTP